MILKANLLMKRNVDALLRARGQTRRDLAQWCRRGDAWIAKIMAEDQREFPMKYFDRIADFFGIATYQLLQPGISPLTERRKGLDRRSGRDRRVSHMQQQIHAALAPANATLAEADIADLIRLRMLSEESRAVIRLQMDTLHRAEREAGVHRRGARGAGTSASAPPAAAALGSRRSRGAT